MKHLNSLLVKHGLQPVVMPEMPVSLSDLEMRIRAAEEEMGIAKQTEEKPKEEPNHDGE